VKLSRKRKTRDGQSNKEVRVESSVDWLGILHDQFRFFVVPPFEFKDFVARSQKKKKEKPRKLSFSFLYFFLFLIVLNLEISGEEQKKERHGHL
jgi:hypothetical protein